MHIIKILGILGAIAMFFAIGYAFIIGDFAADGAELLGNPWGIVSLVDLYVGFILFSAWIVFRERGIAVKVAWIAAMMTLGFFAGALYVAITASRSKNWDEFFLGARAAVEN